jgi:6-phosphogluconolactonase
VITYKFDAQNGKLTQHSSLDIEKGSGPRHFVFHPSKKYAYVVNELACTVTVCSYDASQSSLSTIQTVSTLPNGFSGNASCSAIRISKDGTALFVANRFQDSISVFSVDENGKIELKHNQPVAKTPRDFTVDPSERVLLVGNQDSHSISTFKINLKEFTLTPLSDYSLSSPACIFFY